MCLSRAADACYAPERFRVSSAKYTETRVMTARAAPCTARSTTSPVCRLPSILSQAAIDPCSPIGPLCSSEQTSFASSAWAEMAKRGHSAVQVLCPLCPAHPCLSWQINSQSSTRISLQPCGFLHYLRITFGPIGSVHCEQPHAPVSSVALKAVAVVFSLLPPSRAAA